MSTPTFQTVLLRRGKHSSPENGVCVMELASMLAGEPFTDRPQCVSPLIAALLRSYNDHVRPRRRQDLYGCAAAVVGTGGDLAAEEARRVHCLSAVDEVERRRFRPPLCRILSPTPRHLRRAIIELPVEESMCLLAQTLAAGGAPGHALALKLVDELAAIEVRRRMAAPFARPVAARRTA